MIMATGVPWKKNWRWSVNAEERQGGETILEASSRAGSVWKLPSPFTKGARMNLLERASSCENEVASRKPL